MKMIESIFSATAYFIKMLNKGEISSTKICLRTCVFFTLIHSKQFYIFINIFFKDIFLLEFDRY